MLNTLFLVFGQNLVPPPPPKKSEPPNPPQFFWETPTNIPFSPHLSFARSAHKMQTKVFKENFSS